MDQSELKEKVAAICQELGGGLPYELHQILGEDWQSLASELADLARLVAINGSRLAAYAAIAQKRANQENDRI